MRPLDPPYVSPLQRARAIVAGRDLSGSAPTAGLLRHAQRIVALAKAASMVVVDLEMARAPWHVVRWVAWGSDLDACRRRAKLVLHLHKQIEGRRAGWPQERHLAAAFAVWEQARAAKRARGGIMPNFDEIPVEHYRSVMEAAPRGRGARAPASEPEAADEALELDPEPPEDESGDAPPTFGREQMRVIRYFALAGRTALEAQDLRAADIAFDAILRLAGEPEDDEGETEDAPSAQATLEQATPEEPERSADRDASVERPTTGDHKAADAAAPATASAVTDTRPLIDILRER